MFNIRKKMFIGALTLVCLPSWNIVLSNTVVNAAAMKENSNKAQTVNSLGSSMYSYVPEATIGYEYYYLDAPNDVTAENKSNSKITLDWDSVSGATSYYVYRSTSYNGTYSKIATVTSSNYTDYNLSENKTYYYKVKAHNSGYTSNYSSIVHATTDEYYDSNLDAPSGINIESESNNKITLNWYSVSGATSYYVYRSTSYYGTYSNIATVTTSSYTDYSLSGDKTYYYKIKAHNSSNTSNYSSIVHATTDSDLEAPSDVTADAESNGKILLNWNDVSDAAGYYVYRSTSYNGTYSKIATVTSSMYGDYNLSGNKAYYYKIKAYNDSNTSDYSSIVNDTTDSDLDVPNDVTANANNNGKVVLNWDDNVDAISYYVYRSTSYNGIYSKIATVTSSSYTDYNVSDDKTYYYKIAAHNSSDTSDYSSIVHVTTDSNLDNPKYVTVEYKSYNKITLDWDYVSGAKGYYVYRSTSYNGTYSKITTVTSSSYTDYSLSENKTYYYKIKAYNGSSTSDYSSIVHATTDEDNSDLDAPEDLTAKAKSNSRIVLDWDSVSDATSYYVYRSTSYSGTYSKIATVTSSSYTDYNLSADKTYYYKVKAHNSSDTSDYSSIVHDTTYED